MECKCGNEMKQIALEEGWRIEWCPNCGRAAGSDRSTKTTVYEWFEPEILRELDI